MHYANFYKEMFTKSEMEKEPEEILIIKTGYSEFLENVSDSTDVSLGDVFRVTPLLELYRRRGAHVSWVTDDYAKPLLDENPLIKEIISPTLDNAMLLLDSQFDTVINLEKRRDLCKLTERMNAWKKFGFRISRHTGNVEPYDRAKNVMTVSCDSEIKKSSKRTAQDLLFELVGEVWNGEEYSLGYTPSNQVEHDIAFNIKVGKKWPNKAWDIEKWNTLESMLKANGLDVTRQDRLGEEIFRDIRKYIDWLNSSNTIVTSDSLGMHLALALKKNVVAIFGPTPSSEVYFYGRGESILPQPVPECMPCFKNSCDNQKEIGGCINLIPVDRVYETVRKYIDKSYKR